VLHYFDINMKLRVDERPVLVWRFALLFSTILAPPHAPKILGFSTEGGPILPVVSHSADSNTVRHEKLGWEEISRKSAKIISFIGNLLSCSCHALPSFTSSCRSRWAREVLEDYIIRTDLWRPFLCYPYRWGQRRLDWNVQGTPSSCSGFKLTCCCVYN
jgi:hypothetical protein